LAKGVSLKGDFEMKIQLYRGNSLTLCAYWRVRDNPEGSFVNFMEGKVIMKTKTKSAKANKQLRKKLKEAKTRNDFLAKLATELLEKNRRRSLINRRTDLPLKCFVLSRATASSCPFHEIHKTP